MEGIKVNIGDQSYQEEVLKPLDQLAEGQEPKEPVPTPAPEKASKDGLITIAQLATELGTNAKALRKLLRDSGFKKEGKRWEWPENDPQLEEIRNTSREDKKEASSPEPISGDDTDLTEEDSPLKEKLNEIRSELGMEEGA